MTRHTESMYPCISHPDATYLGQIQTHVPESPKFHGIEDCDVYLAGRWVIVQCGMRSWRMPAGMIAHAGRLTSTHQRRIISINNFQSMINNGHYGFKITYEEAEQMIGDYL